jgi:protein-S-isoprenylcysteine O-methyltransferase Ste14
MLMTKLAYWLGVLLQVIIRAPFAIRARARAKAAVHVSPTENILLLLLMLASGLLSLLYSVTNWLSFADYHLPAWGGWLGVFVLVASLLVFWRGHHDLQANWSSSLEIYEGHMLITNGIYRFIRHPMYLSELIWAWRRYCSSRTGLPVRPA